MKKLIFFSLLMTSTILIANSSPSSYEDPSDTYLNMTKSSIGASTNIQTISGSNTRGLTRISGELGWGGDSPGGSNVGGGGGVGGGEAPIGDYSLPMIFGIIVSYFVVRGVSSKKKKIM